MHSRLATSLGLQRAIDGRRLQSASVVGPHMCSAMRSHVASLLRPFASVAADPTMIDPTVIDPNITDPKIEKPIAKRRQKKESAHSSSERSVDASAEGVKEAENTLKTKRATPRKKVEQKTAPIPETTQSDSVVNGDLNDNGNSNSNSNSDGNSHTVDSVEAKTQGRSKRRVKKETDVCDNVAMPSEVLATETRVESVVQESIVQPLPQTETVQMKTSRKVVVEAVKKTAVVAAIDGAKKLVEHDVPALLSDALANIPAGSEVEVVPASTDAQAKRRASKPSSASIFGASPNRSTTHYVLHAKADGGMEYAPLPLELSTKYPEAPRLTIDIAPRNLKVQNVRLLMKKKYWEVLRKEYHERCKYRCEICGGMGERWPVELHEKWSFDDRNRRLKLLGMVSLCPSCHLVKHANLAKMQGKLDEVMEHLAGVNKWSIDEARTYVDYSLEVWTLRSRRNWQTDLSCVHKYIFVSKNERRTEVAPKDSEEIV
eukprot:TRINITY_DN2944_c0_g5_i1.p1 TRINITY_DN2944_c0_g5~~TRINITY_DN2944_c0_g5_i1.p1  ORF type:complete len:487 (+),score=109.65 TRINITY_DN2944_c0_g5_i1:31-1491(+)